MNWTKQQKKVLVPFVLSQPAMETMEIARDIVGGADDVERIHVLHVVTQVYPTSPALVVEPRTPADLKRNAELEIRRHLDTQGFSAAHLHIAEGEPATCIRELAKELAVDLVIMPSHGRSGVERWLLGSVAEHVLRDAPCPILVLPIEQLVEAVGAVQTDTRQFSADELREKPA